MHFAILSSDFLPANPQREGGALMPFQDFFNSVAMIPLLESSSIELQSISHREVCVTREGQMGVNDDISLSSIEMIAPS